VFYIIQFGHPVYIDIDALLCGQLICLTLTIHNNNAVSIISLPRKMCKSPFSHSSYEFLTQEWLVFRYAVTELVCFKGPK
jgi:hypothetical protein